MPLTPQSSATLPARASVATPPTPAPLWCVIFAGGIGSRFWPLSTPDRPKPVLKLLGDRPLIADTIHRLADLIPPERVLIVTARDIGAAVGAAVPEIPSDNLLIEPRPLGTAASLAWALEVIRQRGGAESLVCAIHADLAAAFPGEFRRGVQHAATIALRDRTLVALGVLPTRPETSFGYAVPGDALDAATPVSAGGACRVTRFVEKPGLDVVAELLTDGALWHSGVLIGTASLLREELFKHATEIVPGREALEGGNLPGFAGMVRSVSIERGLLERTRNIAVVPIECGWDDVGTWACLRRARDLDDDGNGAIGNALFFDSTSNVVHSETGTVVLFGCQRMLVVTLNGLTFVTPLEKAADLKPLLDQLPGSMRTNPTGPAT